MKEFLVEYVMIGDSTQYRERISAYNQADAINRLKKQKGNGVIFKKATQQ